ncbi:MAG: aspartyl protease family protein [Myxococcales bacterium]
MKAPLAAALAGLSACSAPWAAGRDDSGGFFADRSSVPVVRVRLNGKGPFLLGVDTGAATCILSPEAAKRIGLELRGHRVLVGVAGTEASRIAVVDSVDVGGVRAEHVLFHVAKPGLEVDGLLGHNFLQGYRLTVDYARGRVLFDSGTRGVMPAP